MKIKRLIIPFKFKYIKSEITLEVSVIKDNSQNSYDSDIQ